MLCNSIHYIYMYMVTNRATDTRKCVAVVLFWQNILYIVKIWYQCQKNNLPNIFCHYIPHSTASSALIINNIVSNGSPSLVMLMLICFDYEQLYLSIFFVSVCQLYRVSRIKKELARDKYRVSRRLVCISQYKFWDGLGYIWAATD